MLQTKPVPLINTYSNADHIGGNRYLQGQTECKVYFGGIEAAYTKYPILEPSFLYGGYPTSAAFASIATKMALSELPKRCLYSSEKIRRQKYKTEVRHMIVKTGFA